MNDRANIDGALFTGGILSVLSDIFAGPDPGKGSWVLNPTDSGLLDTIDDLTAEQASRPLIPNRSTVAGHVGHLQFSLRLITRWGRGENPYTDADWNSSWDRQTVTEDEWAGLRSDLRRELAEILRVFQQARGWDEISLTGAIAAPAHAAYHLGAIRQLPGILRS